MRHIFLVLVTVFAFASCRKEEKVIRNKVQAFYNLEDFAKQEALHNSRSGFVIEKNILLNGKKETTRPDSINWEKELRPLEMNDINKVSWVDKFKADTIQTASGKQYRYITTDIEVPVKKLLVDLDSAGEVSRIYLETVQNNPLLKSQQVVNYFPGKGYTVRGKQKARFLSENTFYIQARFIKGE